MKYPSFSVLSWLEKSVEKYGEKTVFDDLENSITFKELDCLSDKIASFLLKRGHKNKPIAVLMGRSVKVPAVYLGIVKAGCYYAPIDSTVPVNRINSILGVLNPDLMITDEINVCSNSEYSFSGQIIMWDELITETVDNDLLLHAWDGYNENFPLYVIFTSGSSGTPKGVVTSHRSLICYINAVSEVLQIEKDDVLGNQSPLDYIAAVRDIYIPLKCGASTIIIPKNEFALPKKLFDTLNRFHVSVLCWSVSGVELPARLNAFREIKPLFLKTVLFSGSVISSKYLAEWIAALPNVRYINQYGPTEATASCTYYEVKPPIAKDTVIPIGKPYPDYTIYLLSEDLSETEQGAIGEICVAGPCLALGYFGNKELTDKSFIQNPLNSEYYERIYLTGDLGKYNKQGLLEFHGRKDRQIKHMGHRIELDEIEACASKISGITSCCSLYDNEKSLLYLFYTGDVSEKDIIIFFRNNMPGYMVPRKVIPLAGLPCLPNGKTNTQELKKYFAK